MADPRDRAPSQRRGPQDPDHQDADATMPPQVTMGLLDYVVSTSLDEGYAHVAAQRRTSEESGKQPRRRRVHPTALVALGLVGLLLAIAGVETARNATSRESSHESLVAQARDRREELAAVRAQVAELRRDIESLQDDYLETTASGRELRDRLENLGVVSGSLAVRGPGVRVVVDDAPRAISVKERVLDSDLQRLANGLWAAGAEAIAINGHRLTNLTAIRTAGEAITVGKSLSRPYVVDAIGDPQQMPARFIESDAGTWWLNLQSVYRIQFDMTSEDDITVPAAPDLRLRLATRPEVARPEVDQ